MTAQREERPWGSFEVVDRSDLHQTKRLVVRPGHRFSYQTHRFRAEHWFIVGGSGIVTLDDEDVRVQVGDAVDIPIGCRHRATNDGVEDLVFVEVQTGTYFGEDDIQRIADDYGRHAS